MNHRWELWAKRLLHHPPSDPSTQTHGSFDIRSPQTVKLLFEITIFRAARQYIRTRGMNPRVDISKSVEDSIQQRSRRPSAIEIRDHRSDPTLVSRRLPDLRSRCSEAAEIAAAMNHQFATSPGEFNRSRLSYARRGACDHRDKVGIHR
jgi:hypothetical protein